jgi:hypothetical protein
MVACGGVATTRAQRLTGVSITRCQRLSMSSGVVFATPAAVLLHAIPAASGDPGQDFRNPWRSEHPAADWSRSRKGRDPELSAGPSPSDRETRGSRPDRERGRRRRGWLLAHASESQVRLQVVADQAGSKPPATPAIATKEGSWCGRSRRRTVEGMEMRTFGEKGVSADRVTPALLSDPDRCPA